MKVIFIMSLLFSVVMPSGAQDLFPQIVNALPAGTWEEYRALNAAETRYAEYKDDDRLLAVKLYQLAYINKSREKHGVPPVKLDILASRVANRMAREGCAAGFSGHWNTRGEKPYQRYALAGGTDHVSENAASRWSSAAMAVSLENYRSFMAASHDEFMAEVAPNDGHKQNVIAKEHNYVGLGACIEGKQFRYYEEYVDRYMECDPLPATVAAGDSLAVRVKPLAPSAVVYAVVVFWEPLPTPMTASDINSRHSYPDYTDATVASIWPWELAKGESSGSWSFPLAFPKKGSYYVHVYLDDKPYKGGSADTRGKTQASGIVIFVR